jgi:hypothetical protein
MIGCHVGQATRPILRWSSLCSGCRACNRWGVARRRVPRPDSVVAANIRHTIHEPRDSLMVLACHGGFVVGEVYARALDEGEVADFGIAGARLE